MLFNSLTFLAFFVVVVAMYYQLRWRAQNVLILVSSYIFYGWWDFRFLLLILISTTVDFWVARKIADTEAERKRRGYLFLSILTNLVILGFFKYFNFFLGSTFELLGWLGVDPIHWQLNIALPIGISFYTFKTLSYTIDVYGREMSPTRSWIDYAAFVAFFPQLVSGPIDRAVALLPQIENPRRITRDVVRAGIWLFFWGLFKKVVVADNLAEIVAPAFVSDWDALSTAYAWTAIYAFALQLYCDFSGYTDMARGVASLLGFRTAINFRNPFFASNPIEFWQRWHISLSKWIQDYIYFPMAAHALRKSSSAWNQYMPHIYTMTLIGLWHGANMTYVAFGFYWGVAIVAYNVYRAWWKRRLRRSGRKPSTVPLPLHSPRRLVSIAVLFHVMCIGLVFFRADSLGMALHYGRILVDVRGGFWLMNGFDLNALNALLVMGILYLPVLLVQIHQEIRDDLLSPLALAPWARIALGTILLVMWVAFAKTSGGAFVYAQF